MLLEMGSKRKLLPAVTMWAQSCSEEAGITGEQNIWLSLALDEEDCPPIAAELSSWLNQRWHLGQFKASLNYKYIFALKIKCFKNQHETFLLFGFILSLSLALYLKLTLNLWTSCLCPWIAEEKSKYPLGTSFSVLKNKNPISSLFHLPYYIWAWPLSKDLA